MAWSKAPSQPPKIPFRPTFFPLKGIFFAITYITYGKIFVTLQPQGREELMSCGSMGGQLPPTLMPLTLHDGTITMYNYIPHPSNCSKSSMITSLLIEEGHAAYGIYWMLLEMLRDCPNYRINPDAKKLAWALHCNDVQLVERVLSNYGLFDKDDDGLLYSPWLVEQMSSYDDKKRRLQEAGRRGAAKRFAKAGDREAIATLPLEDREAIAILPNITQHNITQYNVTSHNGVEGVDVDSILSNPGPAVTLELAEAMSSVHDEAHNAGYVAQELARYGVGENVLAAILRATNNADMSHPLYKAFCDKIRKIKAEKWRPNMPNNFFLRFITNPK